MKTASYTGYGGPEVIKFCDTPIPQPAPGQVLIRVLAAPVTAGDARMRSGNVPRGMATLFRLVIGWNRPRIAPGWGFSGVVEGLGLGVSRFVRGQKVFGLMGMKGGSHAEYLLIKADGAILPLPEGLDITEGAAFFFGGLTAQNYLVDKAMIGPGERVLINGASGSVGSAAVQIAAHMGAEVTAVCSTANHEMVKDLGASAVHDYRHGPVSGQFDMVLDVIGTLGWTGGKGILAPGGRLCLITASLAGTLGAALRPRRQGRRVIAGVSSEAPEAMARLVALYEAGAYHPVVSQVFPFADLRAAHAIAESFHKPGNLVVVMAGADQAPDQVSD